MKCPFCGNEMKKGKLYGEIKKPIYWLPEDIKPQDIGWLSAQKLEKCSGFFLGEVTKSGLFLKESPLSHYCPSCDAIVTKINKC